MFKRFDQDWPPTPWQPPAPGVPRLNAAQERRLLWLIVANLLALLIAPLAGGTLVQLAWSLLAK